MSKQIVGIQKTRLVQFRPRAASLINPPIACIVIPTYNERKNIISLLNKIFSIEARTRSKPFSLQVLVVDDSSPDGTAAAVSAYQRGKNGRKVHLLIRKKKEGLGAAYIAGMLHALRTISPEVIMEMDADHSHNPADIYRLLAAIESGADFVIGSRYIAGGATDKNWGLHRKIISTLASTVTRVGLRLTVRDCSGGYRAIRSSLLRKIKLTTLDVRGYAFQAVLLEAAAHNNALIQEVPIKFLERHDGESKMRLSDMLEGWKVIFAIRFKRLRQRIHAVFK